MIAIDAIFLPTHHPFGYPFGVRGVIVKYDTIFYFVLLITTKTIIIILSDHMIIHFSLQRTLRR